MPTAYVLILLDYNYPDYEIMSQLDKLPCVIEVNKLEGPYDIVVKLSDNNVSYNTTLLGRSKYPLLLTDAGSKNYY